jgi:hypothetical protein
MSRMSQLITRNSSAVPGSLDKNWGRRFHLSFIFCHSAILGLLVQDGIFSLGGRNAARLLTSIHFKDSIFFSKLDL